MPAHFTGEGSAALGQLGLDQRVPGLPHHRLATGMLDFARDMAAAFDIENNGRPWLPAQHIAGEQHQQPVWPHDLAGFGDDPEAVGIAVESQAQFAIAILHVGDKRFEIVRIGRIGVVVGEVTVHLAIEFVDLASQGSVKAASHFATHAVAAVDGNLHGARQ
jgi:hypothetical protein